MNGNIYLNYSIVSSDWKMAKSTILRLKLIIKQIVYFLFFFYIEEIK